MSAPGDASQSPDRPLPDEWSIPRIVRTMVPLLAVLSVLQLVSGTVLQTYEATLVRYPALLVLVPVQIGTAGNLASITCSRLTTQLYLGTYALGGALGLGRVLLVSLSSGMLLAGLVVVTSVAAVEASYRVGLNPDDTTIPVVTNVCDIAGVLILFAVVTLVV